MPNILADLVLPLALLAASPFVGGLLAGIDRRITARMQGRIGPPLAQPFYDVIKLWGKSPSIASRLQPILSFGYLGFALLGAAVLTFRLDLLLMLFVISLADVCLIAASFNSKSPFSNMGAKRELLSVLAYDPVIIMVVISIYLVTGSFLVDGILSLERPILTLLPGAFAAMELVLLVQLRKSPFDVSATGHAHQELVRGVYTELSGYTMAMVEVGHWVRVFTILSLAALFWAPNLLAGSGLAFALFFTSIVIDNVYPRLTWQRMLRITWLAGFLLLAANIAVLIIAGAV